MKNIFILWIISSLTWNLKAQAPDIEWQKMLGGSSTDVAYAIRPTSDGGYIVSGSSLSNDGDVSENHGSHDYWIVKTSNNGNIQWQKTLGGSSMDKAFDIETTPDGGYVVAGMSYSSNGDVTGHHGSGADFWIVKLNNVGNIQWQKALGGSGEDWAHSIQPTSDGGYIVAGWTDSDDGDVPNNNHYLPYWIVKLDSSGNIQWQKVGSGQDEIYAIRQTNDGGYITAGRDNSTGNNNYAIIKFNNVGNVQWQKSIGGSSYDEARDIRQTTDGGYIVCGWSWSNDGDVSGNHGGSDYWIVKLDSSANIQWQKCLGGSSNEQAYSAHITPDGGYIVMGWSESNNGDVSENHGSTDYWVVKLSSNGNIQWQKSIGGSGREGDIPEASFAISIYPTSNGGYILAGGSSSNDGDASGNHGGYDYWIVKLGSDLSIEDLNQSQISIYPNPTKNIVNFSEKVKDVIVYDLSGKSVKMQSSTIDTLDISSLPTGNYILTGVTERGEKFSKKIIKK